MLKWSLAFFLVALLAALLGFTEIASGAAWAAQWLCFLFLACFIILLVSGMIKVRRERVFLVRVRPVRRGANR
jgi:uncharacterized membrane protein YtjA (UPF0391 family)